MAANLLIFSFTDAAGSYCCYQLPYIILKDFYVGLRPLNGVPLFEAGNIPETSAAAGDGYGCIADQGAMATLTSVKMRTERERDASLRGTEVVITADYGVFELDNDRGAPMLYDISGLITTL